MRQGILELLVAVLTGQWDRIVPVTRARCALRSHQPRTIQWLRAAPAPRYGLGCVCGKVITWSDEPWPYEDSRS